MAHVAQSADLADLTDLGHSWLTLGSLLAHPWLTLGSPLAHIAHLTHIAHLAHLVHMARGPTEFVVHKIYAARKGGWGRPDSMPQAISTTEIPTPRGAWPLRRLTVALPPFSNGVEFVLSAEFHYRSVYRVSQKSPTN